MSSRLTAATVATLAASLGCVRLGIVGVAGVVLGIGLGCAATGITKRIAGWSPLAVTRTNQPPHSSWLHVASQSTSCHAESTGKVSRSIRSTWSLFESSTSVGSVGSTRPFSIPLR